MRRLGELGLVGYPLLRSLSYYQVFRPWCHEALEDGAEVDLRGSLGVPISQEERTKTAVMNQWCNCGARAHLPKSTDYAIVATTCCGRIVRLQFSWSDEYVSESVPPPTYISSLELAIVVHFSGSPYYMRPIRDNNASLDKLLYKRANCSKH